MPCLTVDHRARPVPKWAIMSVRLVFVLHAPKTVDLPVRIRTPLSFHARATVHDVAHGYSGNLGKWRDMGRASRRPKAKPLLTGDQARFSDKIASEQPVSRACATARTPVK